MPLYTERLTQALSLMGYVAPVSQGAGSVSTAAIDMSKHRRVFFIIGCGVLGSSATVDFLVKGDTASGGSFSTTITGTSITQLVKASNDGSIALVEVSGEAVQAQGYRYIKGTATVGTAASLLTLIALADNDRYSPSADNLAAVVQTVAV